MDSKIFIEAAEAAGAVRSFVQDHEEIRELQQKKHELTLLAARTAESARAAAETLPARLTIGVFGASQSGKSHLVSRMAAPDGSLQAVLDGETIDFIRHINPPGGDKEATGFITRFTHQRPEEIPGFPLKVRVLNECDIGKILVNSFFHDLNLAVDKPSFTAAAMLAHLTAVQERYARELKAGPAPDVPGFEDLCSLMLYVLQQGGGWLSQVADTAGPFWQRFIALMGSLPLSGRAELMAVFWCRAKVFTFYYRAVAEAVGKFAGHDYIYVPLDAFVRKNAAGVRDNSTEQHNIINIQSLRHILDGRDDEITAALGPGQLVTLPFAALAAACLELTFPLPPGGQLDNFDVLDFPGARSREQRQLQAYLDDEALQTAENVPTAMMIEGWEFLRRGKVAYLFERSAARGEIDILMLCVGMHNQVEVTDIVGISEKWIAENVGADPAARARVQHNPFYFVLTRADEPLNKEVKQAAAGAPGNVNLFISTPLERFSGCAWMKEWTPHTPFNNCFIVRKPGMNGDLFVCEGQRETALRPEREAEVSRILQEIKRDSVYRQRLYKPDQALDAMMQLDDGGISFLLTAVGSQFASKEELHDRRLCRRTAPLPQALLSILKPLAHFGGQAEQQAALQRGLNITRSLLQCESGRCRILGSLREALEISDVTLQQAYEAVYSAGPDAAHYASRVLSLFGEVIAALPQSNFAAAAKTQVLAELQLMLQSRREADGDELRRRGFFYQDGTRLKTREELSKTFDQLLQDFARELLRLFHSGQLNLQAVLTASLEQTEHASSSSDQERMIQAHKAQIFLSDFVSFLRFREFARLNGEPIRRMFSFDPQGALVELSESESCEEVFSQVPPRDDYLPLLDDDALNYARRYWADYFSVFVSAMKLLSTGGERGGLTARENDRLCRLVTALERAAQSAQAGEK